MSILQGLYHLMGTPPPPPPPEALGILLTIRGWRKFSSEHREISVGWQDSVVLRELVLSKLISSHTYSYFGGKVIGI